MGLKHGSVGTQLTKAEWEADDVHELAGRPAGEVIVTSVPPSGKCRIVNLYYDPVTDKAIVEYEDNPIP